MNGTFTQDHLLLYIYNELNETSTASLEKELGENQELRAQLQELRELQAQLDLAICSPSSTSVEIVLEASHNSHLETH